MNGHGGNTFKSMIRDLAMKFPDFFVLVANWFDIVSKEDNSGYYVTVIGYPAKYVRWRTATAEDNAWIHNEKITPIRSQEATQAITK